MQVYFKLRIMPQKRDHIVFSQKTATTSEYKIYSVKDLIFLGTIKGKLKKTQWKCLDENGNLLTTLEAKKEAMDFFREMDTKRMMAKGGGLDKRILVVLDEGNGKVINDLYTQWNNIKTDKEQANSILKKPLTQNRMKWIFFIMSIFSMFGAVVTAPTQQAQTHVICAMISFSTFCIISEIQKYKRNR